MNEKINKFINRIKKVWVIVSAIMSIASFVIAIVSCGNDQFTITEQVVLAIVILNSVLLIIFAIYSCVIWYCYHRDSKEVANAKKEKEKTEETYKKCKKIIDDETETFYRLVSKCHHQIKKYLICIEDQMNKALESNDEQREGIFETLKLKVITNYNEFFQMFSEAIKTLLNSLFAMKGLSQDNAISIKQLDVPITIKADGSVSNINERKIITTYRDETSFRKREVGKIEYHLDKNEDFMCCINKSHYINNDITKGSGKSYQNESEYYGKFYNCTIVVPLSAESNGEKVVYGFLACDTSNTTSNKDIYDERMVNVMSSMASIIVFYFDMLDQFWGDALNTINNIPQNYDSQADDGAIDRNQVDKKKKFEMEFLRTIYEAKLQKARVNKK